LNKLSFVISGRNDNYDGNFDERLIIALHKNIEKLPEAEFIFVEWNPYLNRTLTSEKLKEEFDGLVKCYVVHPKYHKYYCSIDGFLEYPAKNVGVRRASGEFIGCMNSDIIFCPNLVEHLQRHLKGDVLYRATRVDIENSYLDVKFPLPKDKILEENYGYMNAAGDFLLMHKNLWHQSTGYCEEYPWQRLHKDAYIVWLLADVRNYKVENIGTMTHWRHPSSWSNGKCRAKVGDVKWDFKKCDFKMNKKTWGLSFAEEIDIDGITWLM
jgi:hypothetical protein